MPLEHAIMVSLTEHPASGYDLARRFERSIGFFWGATHQQIYRVLKRMGDAGWVEVEAVEQEGRPDKKVYTVTPRGHEELRHWLAAPTDPAPMRSELAVKLRGASLGDITALRDEIERHRDGAARQLDAYRAIEKRDFPHPARLTGRDLHQYLVLRGGIRVEQGLVDWYEEILGALGAAA